MIEDTIKDANNRFDIYSLKSNCKRRNRSNRASDDDAATRFDETWASDVIASSFVCITL